MFDLFFPIDPNSEFSVFVIAPRLLRGLKIVKFLQILRLLKMLKLKYVLYRLEEYIVTDFFNAVVDLFKILFFIAFLSHIMGWIYFYIGTYDQ